jgi:hypothetical protein
MKTTSFYLKGISTCDKSHLNLIEDPIESVTKSIVNCSIDSSKEVTGTLKVNISSEASG